MVEQSAPSWSDLVSRVAARDQAAIEELYRLIGGFRPYIARMLGPDCEDHVQEVFLAVVQAIQRRDLRDPDRLLGFIRTVGHRRVAGAIDEIIQARRRLVPIDDPTVPVGMIADGHRSAERMVIDRENRELADRILRSLSSQDRELLARRYLREQSPTQICREMGLTGTQYRVRKHRALQLFGERGRAMVGPKLGAVGVGSWH